MKSIAVVTGARSDFGIWLPVLRGIQAEPNLRLRLIACAMHLAPRFGYTIEAIRAEGFEPECIETLLAGDSPEAVAKSIGMAVMGFSQAFNRERPDLLFLLGDRTETLAAAVAALPFNIPIAHLHGGEATEGLIDDAVRHAITKMSHLHFVSTEIYATRVRQMGEVPDRVIVCGAPALDNLNDQLWISPDELERRIGLPMDPPPLVVTYHPVTLSPNDAHWQIAALLDALDEVGGPVIITYPNADTGNASIIAAIRTFEASRPHVRALESLGTVLYYSLLRHAAAMVGNSSSGLIESASFKLPTVNIGERQKGRVRGANVIDCGEDRHSIAAAIRSATSPAFRQSLADLENPYGDGHAAQKILAILSDHPMDSSLLRKPFYSPR